jgi:hypothetical protein
MDSSVSTVELGLGNVLSWVFRRWHRAPFNSLPNRLPWEFWHLSSLGQGFLNGFYCKGGQKQGAGEDKTSLLVFCEPGTGFSGNLGSPQTRKEHPVSSWSSCPWGKSPLEESVFLWYMQCAHCVQEDQVACCCPRLWHFCTLICHSWHWADIHPYSVKNQSKAKVLWSRSWCFGKLLTYFGVNIMLDLKAFFVYLM